jgi:GNAT superfamily N-acetyltransferase
MNNTEVKLKQINNLKELGSPQLESAVDTYVQAFALLPYEELFTRDESLSALQFILDKDGDLLLGQEWNDTVSLAGGYLNDEGDYFIEELAVRPDKQRQGIGRETLEALIDLGVRRNPDGLEIRTTASNTKAIPLYQDEGFILSDIKEVVPKKRQDGKISLDERVYLRKPLKEEIMERPQTIKRAVIAYPSGNTTGLIFDQLLNLSEKERQELERKIRQSRPGDELEQFGFITLPKNKNCIGRLEMFGGEFCGNGTRSAIWAITGGQDYKGLIEVSGVTDDRPLNFEVRNGQVSLEMPIPDNNLTQMVDE